MAYPNETKRRIAWLRKHGFVVGARDTRMNTAFVGTWMVAENYELGHTQVDGSGGVWCIVGVSLAQIVDDAYDHWYEEKERRAPKPKRPDGTYLIKRIGDDAFWSDYYYGWCAKSLATRYVHLETADKRLPVNGEWYRLLPGEV